MYNYPYQQQPQQRYQPMSYGQPYASAQLLQPRDGIIRVTGMDGAKAYQMPPNSREALFDDTDEILIIKATDGAGFPSYKRARLEWINESEPTNNNRDYVTRDEFERWKEEHYAQYAIPRRRRYIEDEPPADAAAEQGNDR